MVMQEVLIKVTQSALHFVDTPNYEFDDMLLILEENFKHPKAKAPIAIAYD